MFASSGENCEHDLCSTPNRPTRYCIFTVAAAAAAAAAAALKDASVIVT